MSAGREENQLPHLPRWAEELRGAKPMGKRQRDPLRNIRVNNPTWEAMKLAVEKRGDASITDILRKAILHYIAETYEMEAQGLLPNQRSERLQPPKKPTPPESST